MWRGAYVFLGIFTALSGFCSYANSEETKKDGGKTKILIISGGASHDFERQVEILQAGLQERTANEIEWVVRRDSSGRSDREPAFLTEGWAAEMDLVIHLHCFPRVGDPAFVDRVLKPHREGTPALVLHGALQSFRTVDRRWYEFCGAETGSHSSCGDVEVVVIESNHLIPFSIPPWRSPREELYQIDRIEEGAIILAEGTRPSVRSEQEAEPVAWAHEYGPRKAKVFATTLGNDSSGMMLPEFLDMAARGLIWALGKNNSDEFQQVRREHSLSGLRGDEEDRSYLHHGHSVLREGESRALSEDLVEGHRAENAIDGKGATYWRSATPGPSVWEVGLPEPVGVTAIAVEWLHGLPPEYVIEGSLDEVDWTVLGKGGTQGQGEVSRSLHHFPAHRVRSVRISIPATGPGEHPGIREVTGYETRADIPSVVALKAGLNDGLRSVTLADRSRTFRLHPDWVVETTTTRLPYRVEPTEIAECADGGALLLVKVAEGSHEVLRLHDEKETTVFLEGIGSPCSMTWDGEWVYLLEERTLSKYRDTNGDGVADERRRIAELSAGGLDPPAVISGMELAIDGWIYAVLSGSGTGSPDTENNGIVRFRRDGSGFQRFVSSRTPIVDFRSLGNLSFEVKTEDASGKSVSRLLNHGVFPGRPLESFPPISGEHSSFDSHGDFAFATEPGGGHRLFFQAEGLRKIFATEDGALAVIEDGTGTRIVSLFPGGRKDAKATVILDRIDDLDLFPLFSSASPRIRQEAVFEVQRRRSNLEEHAIALLQDRQSPSYLPSLALLSQMEGERTFLLLADAARLSHQAAAYRLLGDRQEARNHRVFAEVMRARDTEVTAEILAAIARSGSEIEGLNELVLEFAAVQDEELSRTAVEWLVLAGEETPEICFRAIDSSSTDSGKRRAAFSILARMPSNEVVSGLIERLERGVEPRVRREFLETLALLYYREGKPWEGSSLISTVFRRYLEDRRVDTAWLLDQMLQQEIPVENLDRLAEMAGSEIPLQAALVDLMREKREVPAGAVSWLRELAGNESHDPNLRAGAAALLKDEMTISEFFLLSSKLLDESLIPESREILLRSWQARPDLGKRLSTLSTKWKSGSASEKELAFLALESLDRAPDTGEPEESSPGELYETGFEVFSRLRCDRCHNVHGEGDSVGPDLVLWIQEHTDSAFAEALENPSAHVADGFEAELIELKKGDRLRGLVSTVSEKEIELVDEAGNRLLIAREDVLSRVPEVESLMPEFSGLISPSEEKALIHFLRGLGRWSVSR